jgi:hypothetical protein
MEESGLKQIEKVKPDDDFFEVHFPKWKIFQEVGGN